MTGKISGRKGGGRMRKRMLVEKAWRNMKRIDPEVQGLRSGVSHEQLWHLAMHITMMIMMLSEI